MKYTHGWWWLDHMYEQYDMLGVCGRDDSDWQPQIAESEYRSQSQEDRNQIEIERKKKKWNDIRKNAEKKSLIIDEILIYKQIN